MIRGVSQERWKQAQDWERAWHGKCLLTFGEEAKQITYAHRMGIPIGQTAEGQWPTFDLGGKSVVDLGGGPCSMLLRAVNTGPRLTVVDPLPVPRWVKMRYAEAGITYVSAPAERFGPVVQPYDEAWLYNVLQHTEDPAKVVEVARGVARRVRVFEWIDTEQNIGHPHAFQREWLEGVFGGEGRVETLDGENSLYGPCWYGEFAGRADLVMQEG